MFVDKFQGEANGNPNSWRAHIEIEIKTDEGDGAGFASVRVAWEGTDPGSVVLETAEDGKIKTRIGNFGTPSIRLTITNIALAGYTYRPELNAEPASIVVERDS